MRLALVALLLSVLCGAALVAPAEAQGSWTCTFDFANGLQGWTVNKGSLSGSTIITSDAYTGSKYRRSLQVSFTGAWTSLTSISVSNSFSIGTLDSGEKTYSIDATSNDVSYTTLQSITTTSTPANPQDWTGSTALTKVYIGIASSILSSASYSGSASISSITLQGTGTAPCSATPAPTDTPIPPTATFTTTPVPPTATPEALIINTYATPTPIVIDAGGIYDALNQANDEVVGLPSDLSNVSRPPSETGSEIFGYVKWLVSPSSADEIAGPFAPIISHTGIFLSLTFVLTAVYAVVWAAVWLLRFVVWIFKFIVMIVDLVLQVAQAISAVIGGVVKFILGA